MKEKLIEILDNNLSNIDYGELKKMAIIKYESLIALGFDDKTSFTGAINLVQKTLLKTSSNKQP